MTNEYYVKKEANRFVVFDEDDSPLCTMYLWHGQHKKREEFEKLINESFEVRE
jgi:IS5 family transposase